MLLAAACSVPRGCGSIRGGGGGGGGGSGGREDAELGVATDESCGGVHMRLSSQATLLLCLLPDACPGYPVTHLLHSKQ